MDNGIVWSNEMGGQEDGCRCFPMVWSCRKNDRIAKRVYIGECGGSDSIDWGVEAVDSLKKKKEVWMSEKQGEWCMIGVRRECMGYNPGDFHEMAR